MNKRIILNSTDNGGTDTEKHTGLKKVGNNLLYVTNTVYPPPTPEMLFLDCGENRIYNYRYWTSDFKNLFFPPVKNGSEIQMEHISYAPSSSIAVSQGSIVYFCEANSERLEILNELDLGQNILSLLFSSNLVVYLNDGSVKELSFDGINITVVSEKHLSYFESCVHLTPIGEGQVDGFKIKSVNVPNGVKFFSFYGVMGDKFAYIPLPTSPSPFHVLHPPFLTYNLGKELSSGERGVLTDDGFQVLQATNAPDDIGFKGECKEAEFLQTENCLRTCGEAKQAFTQAWQDMLASESYFINSKELEEESDALTAVEYDYCSASCRQCFRSFFQGKADRKYVISVIYQSYCSGNLKDATFEYGPKKQSMITENYPSNPNGEVYGLVTQFTLDRDDDELIIQDSGNSKFQTDFCRLEEQYGYHYYKTGSGLWHLMLCSNPDGFMAFEDYECEHSINKNIPLGKRFDDFAV